MAGADPLAAARARLLLLKSQRDAGTLDEARYDEARRAIEREIGEGLLGNAVASSPRPSLGLVAVLAVFVIALAGVGYWQTGSPSLARHAAPVAGVAAADSAEPGASAATGLQQIEAMVGQLAERMKDRPDDAEGWTMLARSYAVLGRFAEAVPAYGRAAELQPNNAALLADYAAAIAATKNTANNPQSIALIDRALKIDPQLAKTLALAGSAAFDRGDFAVAIAHWQKIADRLPPGSELAPRVQAMIGEARTKLGGGGSASSSPPAPPMSLAAAPPAASGAKPAAGTSVSGTVTLDPALAAQTAPTDSVFVFARAASGSRMPLAVKRAQVKDLPLSFTLDDSMAMAPGMTLSSAPQLTVGARISKSGNAIAQPGDLAGETTGVAPGAKNLAIRIGSVVARP
jgi:cytochrome c-type biogenesis protein CcmH